MSTGEILVSAKMLNLTNVSVKNMNVAIAILSET